MSVLVQTKDLQSDRCNLSTLTRFELPRPTKSRANSQKDEDERWYKHRIGMVISYYPMTNNRDLPLPGHDRS